MFHVDSSQSRSQFSGSLMRKKMLINHKGTKHAEKTLMLSVVKKIQSKLRKPVFQNKF